MTWLTCVFRVGWSKGKNKPGFLSNWVGCGTIYWDIRRLRKNYGRWIVNQYFFQILNLKYILLVSSSCQLNHSRVCLHGQVEIKVVPERQVEACKLLMCLYVYLLKWQMSYHVYVLMERTTHEREIFSLLQERIL